MQTLDDRTQRIRELNDQLRQDPRQGKLMITNDVTAIAYEYGLAAILKAIRMNSEFTEDNDPHGEHDFGSIKLGPATVWWKIDYYDRACKEGSEDPANPSLTTRVMTIMTPSEY